MSRSVYLLYAYIHEIMEPLIIASPKFHTKHVIEDMQTLLSNSKERSQGPKDSTAKFRFHEELMPMAGTEYIRKVLKEKNLNESFTLSWPGINVNIKDNMTYRVSDIASINEYFLDNGYDVKLGFINPAEKEQVPENRGRRGNKVTVKRGESFSKDKYGDRSPFKLVMTEDFSPPIHRVFRSKEGADIIVDIDSE